MTTLIRRGVLSASTTMLNLALNRAVNLANAAAS
jgi:hypothetical protein